MTAREFTAFRKLLKKSQRDMSRLLGLSIKAVHSYEQGRRKVPGSVERQVFFLYSRLRVPLEGARMCWTAKHCPPDRKHQCPAWEFNCGTLCWFISGTFCQGAAQKTWDDKIRICRNCEVFQPVFAGALETVGNDRPQGTPEADNECPPDQK